MMKRLFLLLCGVMWLVGAQGRDAKSAEERYINTLLSKMTLEEKVTLLHGNSTFYVGGIPRLGIPEWAMSDGPHGVRAEFNRHNWQYAGWTTDSATYLPTGTAIAATWNLDLCRSRGETLGEEARWRGKDVLLGPGVNIIRSPLCGRNFEYLSEDPYLAGQIAASYITGLQSRDVAACVKHFAANNQERWRLENSSQVTARALHEIYLPAFKAAVTQGGSLCVMSGYNQVNGTFCAENAPLVRDILKGEWGFEGVYMSDWGAAQSTVASAMNGLDVEMGTWAGHYDEWFFSRALLQAVRAGEVPMSVVDDKVRRVLRVMYRTRMIGKQRRFGPGSINTAEHQREAYREAAEAIVLLQNRGDLLPLNSTALRSVAVIGDNATRQHSFGGMSSEIKTPYEVTPLQGLRDRLAATDVELRFAQGYEAVPRDSVVHKAQADSLVAQAVAVAQQSDVAIVCCGLNHYYDAENVDRDDYALPYGQAALIQAVCRANPRTIVVVVAGSPVDLVAPSVCAPTVVWAWLNGMEGGHALADVLLGQVNPSGKLPFTLGYSLDQYAPHALGCFPGNKQEVTYDEGIYVGYRWFEAKQQPVLFPFGHGLSYTSFAYGTPKLSATQLAPDGTLTLTVPVTNVGAVAGKVVVQLYVEDVVCSVDRPRKELKGFAKLDLLPGQTAQATFTLTASDLAHYDERKPGWVAEPGDFRLHIGASSADIRQTVTFTLTTP
ncbi:MAG: glycoside hydrolase family 3 C-terminal domain-containing protein [Muribaculaceae bacterium]|nr:glycoside hydrolase family 3 C-terminal domain-containing protein [Muribaculaceae bacterium]